MKTDIFFRVLICLICVLFIVTHNICEQRDANPETEVDKTMEGTAAPDNPSVPTTEETIHNDISYVDPNHMSTHGKESSSEPTDAPTTPEATPDIDPDELEMLACVIYQEAGGNSCCDDCRRRVADIVLNRVADKRFPNTIYDVLTAKQQYGRFYWTGIVWPERHTKPGEKKAVERAYRIAREVLSGQHSELYGKGYVYQAEFEQGKEGFWCCGHYFGKS